MRNGWTNSAFSRRLAIGFRVIALVGDDGARRDVGTDVEQRFEMAAVALFTAGQIEADRRAVEVGLEMDFCREPAARTAERLAFLPPLAPAAET